ncbi:MAG TPA: efflux RND transporter periplasmic adaptor subunit [Polyangium sp.]|nr:efflux RND transporter periplasmic adaptor subunit [Polyangium sp.]
MRKGACVLGFALLLATSGCDKHEAKEKHKDEPAKAAPSANASAHGHGEGEHGEHEELPRRITLSPSVITDARIRTAPIRMGTLAITIALPGAIAADPDRSARISSPAEGKLEEVHFKEGAAVKKGDVLAVVRVPELGKVRGAQAATLAKAKAARENAARLKALLEQRLTSEQAVLDAEAEARALSIEAAALGAELTAMGAGASRGAPFLLTLRAPIDGTILARDAVVGQPVTAEHVLGSIADLREVWFLGRVFEKDLGRLRVGAGAEVELNAYPITRFTGSIEYIGQQIDPVARTVTARIHLQNRDDMLRIGLFGTAYVATGGDQAREPRLLVPRSAITEIGQKPVVFVKLPEEGAFEMHDVVLGDSALGSVEVLSGLGEGEEVVVEGVFTLKSTVLKGTIDEEGHH